ncbi:hypothetical protein LEP1GSC062_1431 [Leptospira alexanderi serovar Manhao 3 str. L 60]|uniref:Uncharacterized protein n=1 Tax=Leptospira alexanderi serovar Manhao 3 str. L 60 TaxID=1049759 RepID=V6HW76_9LEPT|nr:hypothetical protein LEP1GSC062_1431 [Leptospira alexanderi serovar Manhao 3 str. L 60]
MYEVLYKNFKKIKSSKLFRYNMTLIFASGLLEKAQKKSFKLIKFP